MTNSIHNGQEWYQPTFPHFSGMVQWVKDDQWMLLSEPYQHIKHGGTARMPISNPDASGKVFYSEKELLARLKTYGWMPRPGVTASPP